MDTLAINVGRCYRLSSGRIIRVAGIYDELARCDVYTETSKSWVQMLSPIPFVMIKEECENPHSATR